MRYIFGFMLFFVVVAITSQYFDSKDPYSEGMHWNYSIICENGFIYKNIGNNRGIIQIFNSDGTPLKCGEKIY